VADRDHHSIGEVLALIQQDFPDVTISKIRFLESQGLLEPDRTQSGYRKFYDADVERLRWVLYQQRENYLPLKVIKDRLEREGDGTDGGRREASPAGSRAANPGPAASTPSSAPTPEPRPAPGAVAPVGVDGPDPLDAGPSSASMTADELAAACGLEVEAVHELSRFGLITSRQIGSADLFDADALIIAQLAAAFLGRGIEARHLKMYKVAADREAGFLEQIAGPLMGHRDQSTRAHAGAEVRELIALGDKLRSALLRRSVQELLGPT
jgi:DNA-binding transcriptional MerR regulator